MSDLFGFTRDIVKERYALRTRAGFVPSCLPGWKDCLAIIHISPAMGANFSQVEITLQPGGEGRGNSMGKEFVAYLLEGECAVKLAGKETNMSAGGFAYVPPKTDFHFFRPAAKARLLIFEKGFQALAGYSAPEPVSGQASRIAGQPFLGNKDARLQVLLPEDLRFDLAVNIFTYEPGATLPFVETHIMEHGLLMLSGQGIYRLGGDWHPVKTGDVIWMAPYCPQWFVAMGPTPASYIYYKDVNRPPA